MPFVIFVAPWFSDTAARYIETLADLPDTRVAAITEDPLDHLAPHLQPRLAAHWRVERVLDSGQLAYAVHMLSQHLGSVDRLLTVQEQVQVPLAQVREQLGAPGMTVECALNFRDKSRMKGLLQAARLPVARNQLVTSEEDAWRFVAETGFPVVVKPPQGAGSSSTYRVDQAEGLHNVLASIPAAPHQPVLIEEFVTGDEHSFDTFCLDGRPVWYSISDYYPSPLEVLQNPWIQWSVVLPREIDDARYDDIRETAAKALAALGMETGMSHLEWFRRRDGSIVVSEVAARPPGAQFVTLMSLANDFNAVRAWAQLMVFGTFEPAPRRYAAGGAYIRAQRPGRIVAIDGLDTVYRELSALITTSKLPKPGQTTATGYEGDGYILLRHPDTTVVKDAVQRIVSLVQVEVA